MSKPAESKVDEDEYLDYEEEATTEVADNKVKQVKGSYAGIHSSNFRDFLLKQNILKAIQDAAFEFPSEGKIYTV